MAAEAWQDFGQKVDLTARIREILLNYPEGTSILKELVQNADDARASCIKFCLDCRQHGTGTLLSPAMAAFQGPALLAFNDGVFSDRDLESISRIGDSKKKEEEGKTGRFGVGFNSCYHLTDVPSFVSGRHLVIFDPHCRHLPNISSTNPGKRIDFVQYGDVAAQYRDQVAPYARAFGCTLGAGAVSGPWPGTLFRFPLRSTELAEASTISKQVYTIESIRSLLEQLAGESFQILLFLKHISSVEVHEWPADAAAPTLLFSCYVSNLSKEVVYERGLFARVSGDRPSQMLSAGANLRPSLPEVSSTYRLELRREWYGSAAASLSGGGGAARRPQRRSYIVSQIRGGGEVAELAEQLSKQFGAVVAWGAVAADVTTTAGKGGDGTAEAAGPPEDGRAFCFLPLPIRTGLPVHVNGYFELSSNRRDIWYGEDMTGSGARRAQWNMQLLLRVIAPAYMAALRAAAAALGHGEAYDRLWPSTDVAQPWQCLLVALYRLLEDATVCWSPARGGGWVAPRSGVLPDQAVAASAPLAAALVEAAGLPLLELPRGVGELMLRHMVTKPRVCTPALARQALLGEASASATKSASPAAAAASAGAAEPSPDASLRAHAPLLLDYCLGDLMPNVTASSGSVPGQAPGPAGPTAAQQVTQAAAQLVGLRLLPLLDGTTAALQPQGARQQQALPQAQSPSSERRVPPPSFFMPTQEECVLLARAGGLLVDTTGLSPRGRSKLAALASARLLNVAHLDAPAMATVVMPRLLPPAWLRPRAGGSGAALGSLVVDWQTDPAAGAAGVDRDWLRLLWSWLSTHGPLSSFLGLPLLPILGGRLAALANAASCIAVLPPSEGLLRTPAVDAAAGAAVTSTGARSTEGDTPTDPLEQLSEMLTQLGLQVVDMVSFPNLPVSELVRGGQVHRCDGLGILAALFRLSATTHHPQHGRGGAPAPALVPGADGADAGGDGAGGRGRSILSVGLAARVAALSAADKRLLRSVLLTEQCLTTLAAAAAGQAKAGAARPVPQQAEARGLLQLLAALPIYESAKGTAAEPHFMALYGTGATCFLAPTGVAVQVLGALSGGFVVPASEEEGRLMASYLGVRGVTAAEAYRSHILPVLASLPPEIRNAAVLGVLRTLPQLGAQDRGFGAWLAQVPFVPNNKGDLHTPGELYDPRNPDLAALLDPDADFPAASLLLEAAGACSSSQAAAAAGGPSGTPTLIGGAAGSGSDADSAGKAAAAAPEGSDGAPASVGDASLVLYMLQQLGLRTTASLDTLLRAARFVERVADAAAAGAVAAAPGETGASPSASASATSPTEDLDMAEARGKALLAYLESEAGRIMGPVGASSALAGAAYTGAGAGAGAGAAGGAMSSGATAGASGGGGNGGSSSGPAAGARKFAAGLFSRARELFGQGGQVQPAVAEVLSFWQELARIRWCPVLQEPPAAGLPWPPRGAVPRVAAPRTVRPPGDMWLCSSCMFLVDGECRSSALAAGLGWSGQLGGSVLAQQLLQLGELHAQVTDPALSQVLAGVVPQLYRSLAALGLHEAPVARGLLHGTRCVWVGNGFAPAGKVAFKGSLDLSPWLYVMPAELAPFKDLLLSYGAADGFSAVQYCSVLQDMAEATGAAAAPPGAPMDGAAAAQPPQPLTEVQLGQVVAVAQALADLTLPPGATIYLPDERGVLARAGDLAFNDAPWLAGQPSAASVRLVHPRISAHVAARLGTPSLRRLLLAASADSMALGTVGGAEAFGQSEALTTRLRHIIGDYPEGPGVLMELLQNADDAGATSLELLLDDTTYPSGSILSPAMAVWQGPALLVANDAVFSPSDFANISRIGQDSKASKPATIGRFGLGFNAVYHFTDLPCFVSGDYLVMFDPHAKYLPGVSAAQPGLKIAFARAQLLQQFPDAFTPFTHLGCNMRERFMGTLFRFPLRSAAAAASSEIKSTPCNPEDVAVLLESFRRQLPAALLFLKNIRTVTAYHRASASPARSAADGAAAAGVAGAAESASGAVVSTSAPGSDDGALRLLFRATRDLAGPAGAISAASETGLQAAVAGAADGPPGGLLQSQITRFIAGSPSDPTDLSAFYKRLANTQSPALPSQMGLLQLRLGTGVTLQPGAVLSSSPPEVADATAAAALVMTVPLAASSPGTMVSERWLVCNALGGGAARELALKSFRSHGTKMVPWVGVAARVAEDGAAAPTAAGHEVALAKGAEGAGPRAGGIRTDSGLDGRAFCFLPLPIRTGLPVHVNGYFELSSNRRDIWYGGDMSGAGAARSSWNVALMTDALAPCYGRVLVAVAKHAGPGEQLYRLLPSLDTPEPWSHLVTALYSNHLGELPIVWTRAGGGRWISPRAALFSDAACAAEPLLRNLLVALGLPLACNMPPAAESSLLRGTPGAIAVGPQHVRRHLAQMLRAAGGDGSTVSRQIADAAAAAAAATEVAAMGGLGSGVGQQQLPQLLEAQVLDPEQAAGAIKPSLLATAVAALLRYCLSDLEGTAAGAAAGQQQQQQQQRLQQELDGLPLLPLADGTIGRLQALPPASAAGKSPRGRPPALSGAHVYVLTHGSLELELLAGLRGRCIAPGLPAAVVDRLQQVVDLHLFNVERLSPALLDSTLLPLLLPPSWQGADEVEWSPARSPSPGPATQPQPPPAADLQQQPQPSVATATGASREPSVQWIRVLWSWLADRQDVLQLASWPVLPIQGGRLGRLQAKSLVLREGGWTEAVSSALLRLGCRLLDTSMLGATLGQADAPGGAPAAAAAAAVVASPALQACVQQPSLTGIVAAIAAAKARADSAETNLPQAAAAERRPGPWVPPTSAGSTGPGGQLSSGTALGAGPWASRFASLTVMERRQLRSYLLQGRSFAGTTPPLTAEGLDLLRSLPIFEVHSDPEPADKAATGADTVPATALASAVNTSGMSATPSQQAIERQQQQHFTVLDLQRHRLAPPDTDPRVLSSAFLRADSAAEEALLERYLGVKRLSHAGLLEQHVGPRAAALPREALAAHVAGLLGRLGEATGTEAALLRQALSDHPIIPTASPAGELRRASELHDPRVGVLTSLLPPGSAFFPAASLAPLAGAAAAGPQMHASQQQQRLLDALAMLGMARSVDLRVLLTAARALHADYAAMVGASTTAGSGGGRGVAPATVKATPLPPKDPHSVTEDSLLSRGRALLKQLELWAGQHGSTGGGAAGGAAREEDPKKAWGQLMGLNWCPVLREAPETGMPWPSTPAPLLAAPRVVRPPSDAWLVGATLHILEHPVGAGLQAALGWNVAPRVSVLAAQLIELGRLHAYTLKRLTAPAAEPPQASPTAAVSPAAAAAAAASGDAAASGTAAADDGAATSKQTSKDETAVAAAATTAAAAAAAADAAKSEVYKAVDGAVHRLYGALSAAIDGPEGDLVIMSFERPDSPCVWVGVGFVLPGVAVLRSEGDFRPYLWVVPEPLHKYGRLLSLMGVQDRFGPQHFASGLASLAAAAAGAPLDDDSLALALQLADCAADSLASYGRPAGQFFVPDAAAIMTPAAELFFNDAEWLETRDVQMAHGALPQPTAEALGVRSLRYAHEVEAQLTAALPCPSPAELRERLGLAAPQAGPTVGADAGVAAAATFLFELLEVADALGLRSVRLVLDTRQHPAQSLLQPALAAFQGPALCAVLPEVALSADELAALLCSRAQPPSVRGRVTAYSAGLQSAFLVSELLQVVSGNSTYMFDPSGAYLGGGGGGPGSAAGHGGGGGGRARGGGGPSPRAKQYVHISSDLLSTFSDQFAVWNFADAYDIRGHVNATLLRLPLHRAAPAAAAAGSAAGSAARARAHGAATAAATGSGRGLRGGGLAVATLESVEAALRQFVVHGPRGLLFLHCLSGIEVSLLRPPPPAAPGHTPGPAAAAAGRAPKAAAGVSGSNRELLLQASVVPLDSDHPRPDFSAAAAAARHRSGGPGALKALAQAFGRSLGRGNNQDSPKQCMCPLELHVMAHNGLLLPAEPELSESQPPGSSPRAQGSGATSGGDGGVSGLGLSSANGGAAHGNTLYRERWLVSSCHDLEGVPLPAAAAAAASSGGRPELVAAVAVCISRDDQRNLFPVSGLYAPVYLPPPSSASSAVAAASSSSGGSAAAVAADVGGSALGRMPFLVAGHFYLSRRNGKHIVSPFDGTGAGGAAAAVAASDNTAAAAGGLPTAALLPQLQHRCEHNRRVLDLAAVAWQNLALYFCSPDQYNGPRERLYDIFPDMAAAASAGGAVDETTLYCVRQMYASASRLPLWRLRTGRFVHLPEGCFLQPTTTQQAAAESLGTAAMGFMARQMPLFDVPWAIKQHLQAADVHGLRTVSPAVVRPLLKNLGRRQPAGPGGHAGGKVVWPGLTVLEATELLLFCSADLVAEPQRSAVATEAGGAAAQRASGRQQAAPASSAGPGAAAPAAGSGSPAGGAGTAQGGSVGGLLDGLTSQVRNVMGELVGPALYDQLRQQALGILGDAVGSQLAASPSPSPSPAPAPAPAPTPRYHVARLLDCKGLPVPTAAGSIESLGLLALLLAPQLAGLPSPAGLLPPQCAAEFVHPDCVGRMAEHFKDPQYRASLELRMYTLDDLARHLRIALPPGWDHPTSGSGGPQQQHHHQQQLKGAGPVGLGRVWDCGAAGQGDGPSGLWLWQLWALVNGVLDWAVEWQAGNEPKLDPLHSWPLLPVLGAGRNAGVLLPLRHCRLAICLPAPSSSPQPQPAAGGKAGGKEAAGVAAAEALDEGPAAAAGAVPALRDLAPSLPAPWSWLAPALHAIGCPLLDPRFRSAVGRHCAPHPDGLPARSQAEAAAVSGAAPTRGSGGAAAGAALATLVEKMRLCDAACGGQLPRRCREEWDDGTRAAVLGLLAEATPTSIDPADIIFLRRLPIFPTHAGGYTALEEDAADAAPFSAAAGAPDPARRGAAPAPAAAAGSRASPSADTASALAPGREMAPVVCSAELLQLVPGLEAALPESVPRRLLRPQPGAARLYTLLGVASLTAPAFLATVALPHLPKMPDALQAMLLTHLQGNWTRLRSDDSLLAALRETPFVPAADGTMKRPPELYDPEHPLFAAAFLGCAVFPREQFAMPAWLAVLRDAGMQHKVTAAAFLAAAEAVASRGVALHMALPSEGVPEAGANLEDPFLVGGATEVPAPVAGARAKVTAAAEQLVGHLSGPQGPLLGGSREWWASLAKVPFVPATLGLPGSRKARQVLTRYSDAAAASDWPLVWSVLPVVAADRQAPAALGQGQLRVRSPPPLAAVVAHLRRVGADGGEEALSAWPASAGSAEDAFRTVLSYLDREGVSGQKAAQLRDVAFIPVARGTLLAPPRRLFVRLKEDFAPFAFEVPPSLASFTPLLKSLGAQDEPRAQDLLESLRALAASLGPQPLNPNQRAAVLRLLAHMAALGGAGGGQGPGGAASTALGGSAADLAYLNTARRERRLLVLSADGRLVPAHSAVCVGEGGGGAGAGRLLGRLDPGALTFAHPALAEAVTRWLGCPRLADVAEERLDPGHPLEPVEQIQGLTLRDARALLASPAFVGACHALLRTHAPLVRGIATHGSLHEVATTLRAAAPRLTFVRSLRTTAVLRTTGAALSPAAEASRVAFDFVEATPSAAAPPLAPGCLGNLSPKALRSGSGSEAGRIFIAEPPRHLPVSWLLASVVSRVLASPVVLPLQPIFTTPASELQQLQPVLLPGGFDAGLETAAQAGTPGAPLLPSDAALLQLKPLRRYCAGELVAYQRTAVQGVAATTPAVSAATAAAVAAELRFHRAGGGPSEATSQGGGAAGSSMCYGRVAAHCGPNDAAGAAAGAVGGGGGGAAGAVTRVPVEVEPGVVQHLLSTQVFCFRSASNDAAPHDVGSATAATPSASPAAASAAGDPGGGSGALSPSAPTSGGPPAAAVGSPAAAGTATATGAGAALPGGDLGPVSSSEMMAAVRDVMVAAGLPLDPTAEQLMGRVAALQEKLAEAQAQLSQAKREADSNAAEAENARGAWQCKICFSRDVDSAYTGCGHTICARCASAAASSRCPVCRKPSQSLLRLYRA